MYGNKCGFDAGLCNAKCGRFYRPSGCEVQAGSSARNRRSCGNSGQHRFDSSVGYCYPDCRNRSLAFWHPIFQRAIEECSAAVFACKTAGADDGVDVAALTPERVELLREVFWDMCTITAKVERIHHPANGSTAAWTERNLDITVESKTAEEMQAECGFSDYQNQALTELLAEADTLDALLTGLSTSQDEVRELLQNLPEDLSPERRAVVETACSLVGKANYFWGGKSLTRGWNSTWDQLRKVTADGNPTTDTCHPYGLDCSGFVDWVFYNVSGGEYILGHGGGARMQHRYCTDIDWEDAQPGDLVFYPDDTHVGIVGGVNADGVLYVIHCASRSNGVIIASCDGFSSAARSLYFVE